MSKQPRKCHQCLRGIAPGETQTYAPWCAGCRQKVIDGKRTGNEPAPKRYRMSQLYLRRRAA